MKQRTDKPTVPCPVCTKKFHTRKALKFHTCVPPVPKRDPLAVAMDRIEAQTRTSADDGC